jgi:hypothetical protein
MYCGVVWYGLSSNVGNGGDGRIQQGGATSNKTTIGKYVNNNERDTSVLGRCRRCIVLTMYQLSKWRSLNRRSQTNA